MKWKQWMALMVLPVVTSVGMAGLGGIERTSVRAVCYQQSVRASMISSITALLAETCMSVHREESGHQYDLEPDTTQCQPGWAKQVAIGYLFYLCEDGAAYREANKSSLAYYLESVPHA